MHGHNNNYYIMYNIFILYNNKLPDITYIAPMKSYKRKGYATRMYTKTML